jgi:hypothetical protein
MLKNELDKNLYISVSQTEGLTSIQQLVDTTPNEIFSFKDITSETEGNIFSFPPFYEDMRIKLEKKGKDMLKEYKSIIKNKLKKPIDLKRLYYEQFEHDIS